MSPILAAPEPIHERERQRHRFRLEDDAALVLDTSRIKGSGPPVLDVRWPFQIGVRASNQEFYWRLLDAIIRVDLAPHTHLSAILPSRTLDPPGPTLALLWRVVNPSRVVAFREHHFPGLIEDRLVTFWHPQLRRELDEEGEITADLLGQIAHDRFWGESLGLRVCAQPAVRSDTGVLETDLSIASWHFITDALRDQRRWFPFVDRRRSHRVGRSDDDIIWTKSAADPTLPSTQAHRLPEQSDPYVDNPTRSTPTASPPSHRHPRFGPDDDYGDGPLHWRPSPVPGGIRSGSVGHRPDDTQAFPMPLNPSSTGPIPKASS